MALCSHPDLCSIRLIILWEGCAQMLWYINLAKCICFNVYKQSGMYKLLVSMNIQETICFHCCVCGLAAVWGYEV